MRRTASSASGKRDVAHLGVQAKQSISLLKALPTDQGLTTEEGLAVVMQAQVKKHFAPKKKEPKQKN